MASKRKYSGSYSVDAKRSKDISAADRELMCEAMKNQDKGTLARIGKKYDLQNKKHIVIALLGEIGTGKSTAADMLAKETACAGTGGNGITKCVTPYTLNDWACDKLKVDHGVVLDSAGIGDPETSLATTLAQYEAICEIPAFLPNVIMIFWNPANTRLDTSIRISMDVLESGFSKHISQVIVVVTKYDRIAYLSDPYKEERLNEHNDIIEQFHAECREKFGRQLTLVTMGIGRKFVGLTPTGARMYEADINSHVTEELTQSLFVELRKHKTKKIHMAKIDRTALCVNVLDKYVPGLSEERKKVIAATIDADTEAAKKESKKSMLEYMAKGATIGALMGCCAGPFAPFVAPMTASVGTIVGIFASLF